MINDILMNLFANKCVWEFHLMSPLCIYVTLKDRKRSLSGQKDHNIVFTTTSTNSMNKLVTHWTLVSACWLLTNDTVNIFVVFLLYCFFLSVIFLIFIFTFSILLIGLFLVFLFSTIIHSCIKELYLFFFSFYWTVHVFCERWIPKSNSLPRSKHALIRASLHAWMQSSVFLALDKP